MAARYRRATFNFFRFSRKSADCNRKKADATFLTYSRLNADFNPVPLARFIETEAQITNHAVRVTVFNFGTRPPIQT